MDYLTLLIDNQNYRLSKDLQSRPSRNLQSIGYQPSFCSNSSPVVVFNHRGTFTLNPTGLQPGGHRAHPAAHPATENHDASASAPAALPDADVSRPRPGHLCFHVAATHLAYPRRFDPCKLSAIAGTAC